MQNQIENQVLPAAEAAPKPTNKPRRQGKASKQRNVDKFRSRKNAEVQSAYMHELDKKLGLLSTDESGNIERTISTIQLTPTKRAIPLSVTTRGVGTTTAIFYSRAIITWNLAAIEEISSIHQVYRVHLWMVQYKLYLCQQIQSEPRGGEPFDRIVIPDDIRELLSSITETVGLFSLVLDSIGKVETAEAIYHMGVAILPDAEVDRIEYSYLTLLPGNIRQTLDVLSNPLTAIATRQQLIQHWSIPGSLFENDVLMNADAIYPAVYGFEQLQADIHSYKNLITRIQTRLPKHAFTSFSWSGNASRSGLWCTGVVPIRVVSTFDAAPRPAARLARRRNAQGMEVDPPAEVVPVRRYLSSNVMSERAEFWSPESTPHADIVVGTASLVGEECFIHSRYELVGRAAVTTNAIVTQYAISDAPR